MDKRIWRLRDEVATALAGLGQVPLMSPAGADVRAWLTETLARLAPHFEGAMLDDTPLADEGLCLDSIALVDLIAAIEQGLGRRVREEEVSFETFGTVGRLVRFLAGPGREAPR